MPKGVYKRTEKSKNAKGKHWKLSEEIKEKMRKSQNSGRFKDGHSVSNNCKEKSSEAHKGIKLSEEHRRKISKSHSGEKCHLWKGGITQENLKIRAGIEIRLWREAVFARDNWTCQKCGDNSGGNLNAHHIQNFAEVIELRTSIKNGITFCKECHKRFHKIYGRKNNTREQIIEFLTISWKKEKVNGSAF